MSESIDTNYVWQSATNRETLRRAFEQDPTQLHPTTGEPLESYRMHFIDQSQYNNPPTLVDAGRTYQEELNRRRQQLDAELVRFREQQEREMWYSAYPTTDRDIGIDRTRFNEDGSVTRTTYLTPSEITERFEEEVGRGLLDQINYADRTPFDSEALRRRMQELTTNPAGYTIYTGSGGMRAFDEAMRNTLGVDLGPRKRSSNPLPKYKIPSFYEQSHTNEHYIYVFKDIVTKRQLMGDTMNQAVVFATAEMEADNELVTKCKLYE